MSLKVHIKTCWLMITGQVSLSSLYLFGCKRVLPVETSLRELSYISRHMIQVGSQPGLNSMLTRVAKQIMDKSSREVWSCLSLLRGYCNLCEICNNGGTFQLNRTSVRYLLYQENHIIIYMLEYLKEGN